MIKKIISALMTVVLIVTLASNALAATNSFPDVNDETLSREVGVLQMLGVISGDGNGNFNPDGTLSRAAFCKMAVITMGRGDEEALYRNRTIFPDVRSNHWARGYINIAVTGDKRIIKGNNNGIFEPDKDISYAQAVTILVRMLGYTDEDAGMLWPDGYLALAKEKGLTDGITMLSSNTSITRAQAAHLFYNLLGTSLKAGGSYISTLGTATDNIVMMQLDVRAADGTSGAIRTSAEIVKTVNGVVPLSILGLRGMLLKDSSGKVLTFLPDENRLRTITVAQTDASWIKDTAGVKYVIPADAPAYTASETKTYGKAFIDIASGMTVNLFYSADGKVDGVYINTLKSDGAVVAGAAGALGSLAGLTGGDTGYKVYKNGAPASMADIKQYDVLTYDKAARILNVTDFRLTGCYENCWPNMTSPSTIKVLGHDFAVLPSAIDSLASYKIGQVITLLLTSDLQVAGATTGGVSGSTAVGIVQTITSTSAKVKLLNGLELTGNPGLGEAVAAQLSGELVTVSSYTPGQISLSKLYGTGATGELDLTKLTVGTTALSPAVKLFERVGTSGVTQITLAELTQTKISASKILYSHVDYAGRVDTLILNDVTGDRYTYGLLILSQLSGGSWDDDDGNDDNNEFFNNAVAVANSEHVSGTTPIATGTAFINGAPGGIAFSADGLNVTGIVTLTEVKNVSRSAFYTVNDQTYVRFGSLDMMVSADKACYNRLNKTWFESIDDARAFSETLTVYYDRTASEGGKIRVVIAG